MMVDIILSIFWGIILVISIISVPYIIIRYEINRRQDKKKAAEGIYIRRVNRFEVALCIFNPMFPFLGYMANSHRGNTGILLNLGVIILTFLFYVYSRYILVAYVKLSPEGVEQRIWFANPTRYPINAIDNVTYFETPDIDDQDMIGFYTRSGRQIAVFGTTGHKNYRIMAIVRFRIEQERWPDMNNPNDVARVDYLDDKYMTVGYFKDLGEVTGLADVDM